MRCVQNGAYSHVHAVGVFNASKIEVSVFSVMCVCVLAIIMNTTIMRRTYLLVYTIVAIDGKASVEMSRNLYT